MAKSVLLSTRAQKDFIKLPKTAQERVRKSLKSLGAGSKQLDIKKLKGTDDKEDLYRLRVGDYRITYFPESDIIKIIRIDHRQKGYGWLVVFFSAITSVPWGVFFKLENDAMALPFIFLSLFLFLRYLKTKKNLHLISSLISLGIATFFWGASLVYLFAFSFEAPFLVYALIPLLLLFLNEIAIMFIPNFSVAENHPGFGLMFFIFSFSWPLTSFSYWKKFWIYFDTPYKKMFWVLLVIGIVNPKYFIFLVPFLSIALARVFFELEKENYVMILFYTIFIIGFSIQILPLGPYQYVPRVYEIEAVQDLVELGQQNQKIIENDWHFGHLIWFYGGKTPMHSGGNWRVTGNPDRVSLSRRDLNFTVVRTYEDLNFQPCQF